jgi:hypothetical protein
MPKRQNTYVVFDGDNDKWAYSFMKGWKAHQHMGFYFDDAHEILALTHRAKSEIYIKSKLSQRLQHTDIVLVLIGESTRYLYRYVRWELEIALELGLPIIAVNLNKKRSLDTALCPPIIRDEDVLHIPYQMAAIKFALADFPTFFKTTKLSGPYYYPESIYKRLT